MTQTCHLLTPPLTQTCRLLTLTNQRPPQTSPTLDVSCDSLLRRAIQTYRLPKTMQFQSPQRRPLYGLSTYGVNGAHIECKHAAHLWPAHHTFLFAVITNLTTGSLGSFWKFDAKTGNHTPLKHCIVLFVGSCDTSESGTPS